MKTIKEINEGKLNEASKEAAEAIKLIGNLAKAFKELTIDWVDDDSDMYNDNAVDDFPFNQSLDELNADVQSWAIQCIKNLKKS
tara:strand:- start:397 stop:648 length:252 start_codon:yes stop_codon:yes gene_type:complete